MGFWKMINRRTILSSVMYLAAGLVLVIFPQITGEVICTALGVIAAAVAMMYLLTYLRDAHRGRALGSDVVLTCVWLCIALFAFLRQDVLLSIVPVVLGFVVLFNGVLKLSMALQMKDSAGNRWVFCLVCALVEMGVGLFFVLDPLRVAATMFVVFGISMLFAGVTDLITLLLMREVKAAVEAVEVVDVTVPDRRITDGRD